jgi:tetratricopeptide (TPR) repeat protein
MIFANIQRHTVERKQLQSNRKDFKGIVHTVYISRTRAFVKGSVRSVDLATGRVFAAKLLESSPAFENKIEDRCCAEYPEETAVLDGAMRSVVGQSVRLFLPWTSSAALYYFDDNDCGLKSAFGRFKSGDLDGALRLSLENLEPCKSLPKPNPKALAHANHNVGMSYFALNQYDKAAQYLEEAQRLRPADIHTEAIAMVRVADDESRQMQRVEEKSALAGVDAARDREKADVAAAKETMTNRTVLDLVGGKLPAAVIIAKIKSSPCRFDTGAEALIALKRAGVPDDVIVVMMDAKR